MSEKVVLVGGVRTPFVKSGTLFSQAHPVDLGVHVLKELGMRLALEPQVVDEVILGNMGNPPDAANIARVVALRSGYPLSISACTVQRNCASALESATTAFDRIKAGSAEFVIAGGTESMSALPMIFQKSFSDWLFQLQSQKTLWKKLKMLKHLSLKSLAPRVALLEALTDPFENIIMGATAEVLVKEFGISREEQDHFALESHKKALEARERLKEEIVPYITDAGVYVDVDNGPRTQDKLKKLSSMRPYFDRHYGSVTVGNSCPITDGAVALAFTTEKRARQLKLEPLAYVEGYAYMGLQPKKMGLGPVYASHKVFKKLGLSLKDMDLIELNEAFAGQVLACVAAMESSDFAKRELSDSEAMGVVDMDKLNVNGGAVALGHPVGATGSRLILTLAMEMLRRGAKHGLATLCIGGGQGGAVVLRNARC